MVRSGFEFRMSLCSFVKRMILDLDHLYDVSVRRSTCNRHTFCGKFFTICIVDFVTMSVTLLNFFLSKQFQCFGAVCKYAWIASGVLKYLPDLLRSPDPASMQLPDALLTDPVRYCWHLHIRARDGQIPQLPSACRGRYPDMESCVHVHTVLQESYLRFLCFQIPPEQEYRLLYEVSESRFFSFSSSESIQVISTFALQEIPPCFRASTTLK